MDLKLLNKIIEENGVRVSVLAEKLGLTYQGLKYKLDGERPFRIEEANEISRALRLTTKERDRIFFADSVDKKSTKHTA